LYLAVRDRRLSLGLFLLPLNLALVAFACLFFNPTSPSETLNLERSGLGKQIVLIAHGVLLLAGLGATLFSLTSSAMYLFKARQLRTGAMFERIQLPSLERLDRLNSQGVLIAWPLLTLGIFMGFVMRELAWTDPKVITTTIAWGVFTGLAHYRFRPEHRGARVAVFTLLAGGLVVLAVLADPVLGTSHQSLRNLAP
jgi:ABC-type transport system involved in cytochrome c biogenesis permease subunit